MLDPEEGIKPDLDLGYSKLQSEIMEMKERKSSLMDSIAKLELRKSLLENTCSEMKRRNLDIETRAAEQQEDNLSSESGFLRLREQASGFQQLADNVENSSNSMANVCSLEDHFESDQLDDPDVENSESLKEVFVKNSSDQTKQPDDLERKRLNAYPGSEMGKEEDVFVECPSGVVTNNFEGIQSGEIRQLIASLGESQKTVNIGKCRVQM